MRVSINKLTDRMIEYQSGGDKLHAHQIDPKWTDAEVEAATAKYRAQNLEVLIQNAINAGYKREEVEAKFVSDAELAAIVEASKTPEQKTAELNAPGKAELNAIDLKSIRDIRKWISEQLDAPKFVKDYEAAAVDTRLKLVK